MTVQQLKNLKAAIKAEMLRRNGFGSLAAYGGSSYDFSTTPVVGMKTLPEHGQKTIDLILKIEDFKDLKLVKENEPIPEAFGQQLIDEVARLSREPKTGAKTETSSCRGACTGLCVGSCMNLCNGCTSCSAACGTGCASGCMGCVGSCQGGCSGARWGNW